MKFKTLKELVNIVENAMSLAFYGRSSALRKGILKVLAYVVGGALFLIVLVAKRIWKNHFVSTCDVSALDGFGAEYGMPHKPPMAASGYVTVNPSVMSVTIPQDTIFVDELTQREYRVTEDTDVQSALMSSSNQSVPVVAVAVGSEYNMNPGVALQFRDEPVAGIESVESGSINGGVAIDVEIDGVLYVWGERPEDYRARLLNRVQNPPHGGSSNDYWLWATRFAFVTDAYVFPNQPNTNSVAVAVANYNSDAIGLSQQQVDDVGGYITDDVRRPVTSDVRVFSVTPVEFTITAYVTPYNQYVFDSVTAAVKNYLRKTKPGSTVTFSVLEDVVRANSTAKTFSISSVTKSSDSVDSIVLNLDFSGNSPVAEVVKLGQGAVNLLNGG